MHGQKRASCQASSRLTPGCQLSIHEWKARKSMSGEAWSATASCPVEGIQLTHPAAQQHNVAPLGMHAAQGWLILGPEILWVERGMTVSVRTAAP